MISPYHLGGQHLAQAAISPLVAQLVDNDSQEKSALLMREAVVEAGSRVVGVTLAESDLPHTVGVLVVAVRVADEDEMRINPGARFVPQAGDVLIGLGNCDDLLRFVETVAPKVSRETYSLQ